ncbi:MAG: hypothetical protein L6437_09795 [Kiritimatiellae bacterium]|nr:hypothetical protein [Kiritimatiellia bacterium]
MTKLKDVNTRDIRDAIRLGCQTMCRVFNRDDPHQSPFFAVTAWPEPGFSFSGLAEDSHIPGRHLNALLTAREVAGIEIDEACIQKHANAAFLSFSGPVPLPLNRDRLEGPPVNFHSHNLREGFHALYALARYQDSAKARDLAQQCITLLFKYLDPVKGLDAHRIGADFGLNILFPVESIVQDLGRAIGPLVKYYRVTQHGPALELALAVKEILLKNIFTEAGDFDLTRFGAHSHSVTSCMSSLAQLAELMTDAKLMARVRTFYDHGLKQLRDEIGWSIEGPRPDHNPDMGEANNTGDIVETALILGRWGYPEYYQDAERILRAHLLPAQLRDVSFIREPENPKQEDGRRDVAGRMKGAWGLPAPYGHKPLQIGSVGFPMDVVGGVVGSLCEAYRDTTRLDQAGHWVNLLFDHETSAIKVESPYPHGTLKIIVKQPAPLFVRMPTWLKPEAAAAQTPLVNGYRLIAQPTVNHPISIQLPLPENDLILHHRTRTIRVRLRGDEVTAMENFGAEWTFFDPWE